MADEPENVETSAAPKQVDDDEQLLRFFFDRDFQGGTIVSGVFRSDELSFYRERYASVANVQASDPKFLGAGAAAVSAALVRETKMEVEGDEPPFAHAKATTAEGKCNSQGQARRLRNAAMIRCLPER